MTLCLQGCGVRVKVPTTITGSILLSFALISGHMVSNSFSGYTQGLNATTEGHWGPLSFARSREELCKGK